MVGREDFIMHDVFAILSHSLSPVGFEIGDDAVCTEMVEEVLAIYLSLTLIIRIC